MSLTDCMECERPVSTAAVTCPHCGAPPQGRWIQMRNAGIAGLGFVAVMALTWFIAMAVLK